MSSQLKKPILSIYSRRHRGYLTAMVPGAIVTTKLDRSMPRGYSNLQIGVVLECGNIYMPNGLKHPFKKMAIRAGYPKKQYCIKVLDMEDNVEFIPSRYLKVIIPPTAIVAYLSFDDLREIVTTLGKSHPTAASIMHQATHPATPEGKEIAIAEAKRFLAYAEDMPTQRLSKLITKNYYSEE